jgi:hypothetical protein
MQLANSLQRAMANLIIRQDDCDFVSGGEIVATWIVAILPKIKWGGKIKTNQK